MKFATALIATVAANRYESMNEDDLLTQAGETGWVGPGSRDCVGAMELIRHQDRSLPTSGAENSLSRIRNL